MNRINPISLVVGQCALILSGAAAAEGMLEEVIVTGQVKGVTTLESSVSVSSLTTDDVMKFTPRSAAEIFRNIPGIRSESTGGEGNANIAVRGLPVAAGGAKFLTIQEDGLPVMGFGDIAFGNSDIFIRADFNIERIEAIRGGSASTLASNSPGGIINMISKTGEEEGGSIAVTSGLDYDSWRTDFAYGAPMGDGWSFHIGGFYREGDGPRDVGYTAQSGGQVKFNITRDFDTGYARVYFKHLDDESIGYLPMPMKSDGGSIRNFDALEDSPHTPYLLSNIGVNSDGNLRKSNVKEGMHPETTAVGAEFQFELANDWRIVNRFRNTWTEGRFISPFPAEVADASAIAESIGGPGASLSYANGPNGGAAIGDPASLNGNGLAMRVHLFDTEYDDFDSFSNDFQLQKDINESLSLTLGYYKGRQNIGMSWLWNSYLLEVKGNKAALLDVTAADGTVMTEKGLIAYGVPFWGNCCTRNYDAEYDIDAPYLALNYLTDRLTVDASVRYDSGDASGSYAGSVQKPDFDVNRDGVISVPEQSVSFVDTANTMPIDYDWDYTSWSIGANYLFTDDLAVFARASHGGRANADRLLFGPNVLPDGGLLDDDAAVDEVDQYELGVKYQGANYDLFVTGFYAETEEQNFEATTQIFFDREYEAYGVEFEGNAFWGNFVLNVGATWTDAEISSDKLNPDVEGNTPRRQPDWIYQVTGYYGTERYEIGANIIGATEAYAQDNNDLEFDSYAQVNAYAWYAITDGLTVSLNVNNLFDETGLTEAEEGSPAPVIRARSINTRTTSLTLRYDF